MEPTHSICKCGHDKEGPPDIHDICPLCKRIGCYIADVDPVLQDKRDYDAQKLATDLHRDEPQ